MLVRMVLVVVALVDIVHVGVMLVVVALVNVVDVSRLVAMVFMLIALVNVVLVSVMLVTVALVNVVWHLYLRMTPKLLCNDAFTIIADVKGISKDLGELNWIFVVHGLRKRENTDT